MARKFSKIDEWELWVPPLDDEREIYKDDPDNAVTMELRFLTKEQRDYYQRVAERYNKSGATNAAGVRSIRQMFVENVRNVTNYEPEGFPVTDGAGIFDAEGDQPMINAVTEALLLRSSLESGLAKKLRSVSDTTPVHRTNKKPGVVRDAIHQSAPPIQAESMRSEISESQMHSNDNNEVAIEILK